MIIRIYAIYNQSRPILIFLIFLSLVIATVACVCGAHSFITSTVLIAIQWTVDYSL